MFIDRGRVEVFVLRSAISIRENETCYATTNMALLTECVALSRLFYKHCSPGGMEPIAQLVQAAISWLQFLMLSHDADLEVAF